MFTIGTYLGERAGDYLSKEGTGEADYGAATRRRRVCCGLRAPERSV